MLSDQNPPPSSVEFPAAETSLADSNGHTAIGFLVPIFLGMIAVFLVRHFQQPDARIPGTPIVDQSVLQPNIAPNSVVVAVDPLIETRPTTEPASPRVEFLATNLQRISWQNPFDPNLWEAADWNFSEDGLRSPAVGNAIASFRQPYERGTFYFLAQPVGSTEPNATEVDSQTALFEVRCLDIKSGVELRTTVLRDRITLTEEVGGEARLLRESPVQEAITAGYLRVSLTGQRILIAWNNQFLINAPQPPRETGHMLLQLVTQNRAVLFRDMRIDGE